MKKIILLTLLILSVGLVANAKKPKPIIKYSLTAKSKSDSEKSRLIVFDSGKPLEDSPVFIWGFNCRNNTSERIYIEWENARWYGSKIVFSNDRLILANVAKTDEAVSAGNSSILRNISSESNASGGFKLFDYKYLKKHPGEKSSTNFSIPIRFADGSIEEYSITFTVWYELTTDYIEKSDDPLFL